MNIKTRQPTGRVPWPLILIEGGEKLPVRFWTKVNFEGPAVLDSPCWLWTGANTGSGYPYGVSWDGLRRVKAHRWSWQTANGGIPSGQEIDHLCRNTLCVRASHLQAVTRSENIRRSDAPGPRAVRENTCKRGHPFTLENTLVRGKNWRECRICRRAIKQASNRRMRLARKAAA